MIHGMWRNEQLFRGSELEEPIILLNPYLDEEVIAFLFIDPIKASSNYMYQLNIKDTTFFPHRIFIFIGILTTKSYSFPNSISRLVSVIGEHIIF